MGHLLVKQLFGTSCPGTRQSSFLHPINSINNRSWNAAKRLNSNPFLFVLVPTTQSVSSPPLRPAQPQERGTNTVTTTSAQSPTFASSPPPRALSTSHHLIPPRPRISLSTTHPAPPEPMRSHAHIRRQAASIKHSEGWAMHGFQRAPRGNAEWRAGVQQGGVWKPCFVGLCWGTSDVEKYIRTGLLVRDAAEVAKVER
ncbi:hypothetical protein PSPO01_09561 [Paraphaeosphaeria sporulosa]